MALRRALAAARAVASGRCAHAQDAVLLLPMTVVGQLRNRRRWAPGSGSEPATTCRTCLWIAASRGPRVGRE